MCGIGLEEINILMCKELCSKGNDKPSADFIVDLDLSLSTINMY